MNCITHREHITYITVRLSVATATVDVGVLLDAVNIIVYSVDIKLWNPCPCHELQRQRHKLIVERTLAQYYYKLFNIKSKFVVFIVAITCSLVLFVHILFTSKLFATQWVFI